MENLLGWLLITLGVVVPLLVVYYVIVHYRTLKQRHHKKPTAGFYKLNSDPRVWEQERTRADYRAKRLGTNKLTDQQLAESIKQYTKRNTASTGTANTGTDFMTGALTGLLIDSIINSSTAQAGTKSSSDWGLDDSGSRSSASDSFSSWSDSSSSSDSGPSSDW